MISTYHPDAGRTEVSKNFQAREFRCKGTPNRPWPVSAELVRLLQDLRDMIRAPVSIISGYRSRDYNTRIGGAKGSRHIKGLAADIKVSGMSARELAHHCHAAGFRRIGWWRRGHGTAVHVDVDSGEAYWRYSRSQSGRTRMEKAEKP